MNRKDFINAGLASSLLGYSSAIGAEKKSKKNVLFIMVDDLRPLLKSYGDVHAITPNIDALANRGNLFKRAYVQQAICGPSRASMLTGLYPDNTKIYKLNQTVKSTLPKHISIFEHFRNNGFHTLGKGKLFHHSSDSFSSKFSSPYEKEKGEMYSETENLKLIAKRKKEANHKKLKGLKRYSATLGPAVEVGNGNDHIYKDGRLANWATSSLTNVSNKQFFMAVGFHKPHLPFNAPKKYWNMYNRNSLPVSLNLTKPKGAPQIAMHNFGEIRSYTDIVKMGAIDKNKAKELVHGYYACISYIDAQVGKVLNSLKENNLEKNTIICILGDHGFSLGEHGLWCKHSNFEEATHSPLIIVDPDSSGGKVVDSFAEFVDIYPTICELASVSEPERFDGISLVPLLKNPSKPLRDYAISQYPRHGGMGYTIRTSKYRYTEWFKKDAVVGKELYDHELFPGENESMIGNVKYKVIEDELSKILRKEIKKRKKDS